MKTALRKYRNAVLHLSEKKLVLFEAARMILFLFTYFYIRGKSFSLLYKIFSGDRFFYSMVYTSDVFDSFENSSIRMTYLISEFIMVFVVLGLTLLVVVRVAFLFCYLFDYMFKTWLLFRFYFVIVLFRGHLIKRR